LVGDALFDAASSRHENNLEAGGGGIGELGDDLLGLFLLERRLIGGVLDVGDRFLESFGGDELGGRTGNPCRLKFQPVRLSESPYRLSDALHAL